MQPLRRLLLAVLLTGLLLAACGREVGSGTVGDVDDDGDGVVAAGCEVGETDGDLSFFNWSDYMDPDLITAFEEEYGVTVTEDFYPSNEELLAKVQAGGAAYDVIVPSDYMVSIMIEEGLLMEVDRDADGVHLVPSIPSEGRARDYWLTHRRQWRADAAALMERAEVVHTSVDDLYRPRMYDAWKLAVARGLPTVLVQDTDVVLQIRDLTAGESRRKRLKWACYCFLYERACRRALSAAACACCSSSTASRIGDRPSGRSPGAGRCGCGG